MKWHKMQINDNEIDFVLRLIEQQIEKYRIQYGLDGVAIKEVLNDVVLGGCIKQRLENLKGG